MGASWLRQLDDDAASGVLWRRPVFYVPLYLLLGVVLGATLGYVGAFAFALTRPTTSIQPGPDGAPAEVANDYTAVPTIGGAVGAVLGLVGGSVLAVRRWRRSD